MRINREVKKNTSVLMSIYQYRYTEDENVRNK